MTGKEGDWSGPDREPLLPGHTRHAPARFVGGCFLGNHAGRTLRSDAVPPPPGEVTGETRHRGRRTSRCDGRTTSGTLPSSRPGTTGTGPIGSPKSVEEVWMGLSTGLPRTSRHRKDPSSPGTRVLWDRGLPPGFQRSTTIPESCQRVFSGSPVGEVPGPLLRPPTPPV